MIDRQFAELLHRIHFELIQPEAVCGPDGRFAVFDDPSRSAALLELPDVPIDVLNTTLGAGTDAIARTLRPFCAIPRMSTLAVAAILNQGVRRMGRGSAFVNVGVWQGFTLLSGMAGNPDKVCIGIDNFSMSRPARDAFMARYEERKTPNHRFHEMDYEQYFAARHREPIGLYLYDGDHAYEHQLRGLRAAEPFFADDCVVVVDDTNWAEPREATLDFIAASKREYEILFDVQTHEWWHPTFWNGVIVFQATGPSGTATARRQDDRAESPRHRAASARRERGGAIVPDFAGRTTPVSLIVCNDESDGEALAAAIEGALHQSWPTVEVLVSNTSTDRQVAEAIESFGEAITPVAPPSAPGTRLRAAAESSRGDFVSFVDTQAALRPDAVELGLAVPRLVHFHLGGLRDGREVAIERVLAAGDDINATVPGDERFVFVDGAQDLPASVGRGRALRLMKPREREVLSDADAVSRVQQLRGQGVRFVAALWTAFEWLSERPSLERLLTEGSCALANDRVRIFELDPPQNS